MKNDRFAERSSTANVPPTLRRCDDSVVLLLDDDEVFQIALSELLQDDGHRVYAFGSVAELPELAALPAVAVAIIDYQLGDSEDGLSFARRLHAERPNVPIIMATAQTSTHLEQSVAAMPYVSLLHKPVRYEALHRLLHERIGLHHAGVHGQPAPAGTGNSHKLH